MATEVDSQEPISLKIKEGEEDGSLTPLNLTFNQHPLGEIKVLESTHNQPLETTNNVGQTGYTEEVAKDIELDNENAVVIKEVEGEVFLQSSLLPKFATEGTSRAKKDYEASDIPNFTGGEMSKNETLMEEQVINQYSNTAATKEASREENLGGLEEDRSKGSQDDEKGGMLTEENNESESYDQIVNILEANSGQSTGGIIHKLDMTEYSEMGTGKLPETCDIEVNGDITLSTNIESSEYSLREPNYQSGVDKESELSFISEVEKMNPEAIKPSKEIQEDENDREDILKNNEDVCISTKSESTVKQNKEAIKNGQGATVSTTLINELIEETSAERSQKTAPDKGGDIDEKDLIFIADKTKSKPEICQDEMESETTAKISENEAGKQDESIEKIVTADSNMNTRSNDNEDRESTEDSTREYKDEAGLAAFVDENNNMAEEHSNTKTSKQNLERFVDVASEEIQKSTPRHHAVITTYSEEKKPIQSLEENLEEEEKERTVHLNEIKRKEILEEKNLSKDDLNENIKIAEVASLHETAIETYGTDPPLEEIKQLGCGEQDQVSKAVPVEQVCEENKILTEEEKQVNETYEESGNLETITYFEEKRPTESLEENLEKEEKERTIHLNEIKGKENPEEKNLSKDDLNDNIEIAEVVNLHETANETYETDPPVEEIKQLACGEQYQVSKALPVEQIYEENKILTKEEKHVNETTYEESRNLETITYSEEKTPAENLEENLEEEEKETTIHLNEINGKEIPEENILSKDDLNENIEIAEVASLHETAIEIYGTDPLLEEIKQLGCGEQNQVSKAVPVEQVCEENKILTKEEKRVNETYEESGNIENITAEHDKLGKAFGGDTDKEKQVQQKGLSATELQILETKSDDNEKDMIKDDIPVLSNITCSKEEADQISQGDEGSSKEEAAEVNVRDKSCRIDNDTMNINDQEISEQVHTGTRMADKDEVSENHSVNKENGSPDQRSKPTSEETIKCYGENETEMKGQPEITVDDPGNGEKVLMEENRIQDQALEKKIDEEDGTLTAQEVHEKLQRPDGGRDIGNQIQEEVGTVKENFATSVGQTTQEGSSYGKQNEEKECDIEAQETGEGQGKLQPAINKADEEESSTRSLQKNEIQENSQQVEEKEECDSAGLNKETEKQNIVESANQDHHSSVVGKANDEENLKQEEKKVMELKEEDKNSETECTEQNFDVTCPLEEAKEKVLKEEVNPSNGCDTQCTTITLEEISLKETNENLDKNSSESQVFEKESQEKILEKAEISVTGEAEEKNLNEREQEEKMQLDNPDLASEEKGLVITELCETRSDDIDIIDKLPEASNMSESKDVQIPKAVTDETAKEAGEKQEHGLQNETHNTLPKSEDEREISTGEITVDYTTEGTLEVYSELNTESGNTESEESDPSKSVSAIDVGKLETPNNAKLPNNELGIDNSGDEKPVNYRSDEACDTCTDTEKVVTEHDNSAEASKSSLTKYVEIEKAVVELETGDRSRKTEDFTTDNTSTIKEESLELNEQLRSSSELVALNQREALPETSVKDNNIEYSDEKTIIPDPQTGVLEMNKEVEEVYGGVELAEESENIIEQIREESCATELQTQSASAETINKINESDPVTIVNHEAIDFSENKETASHAIEDLNRESEDDTVTKPPEEEIDEGTEKHINFTSSAYKASGEILKEENKEETDKSNGKTVTAPVIPVTAVDHEAIDFSENKETASHAIEDLNWESVADTDHTVTKPPEEEIDEGTEKHINITSSALEASGERLKEENKQETDSCNGKMDTAPVKLMTEETSLEEIHLDDNPVLALDSTSDDRNLVLKTAHTTVHGAESDSPKLEECYCKVPQQITIEHANPDEESGIVQKTDADEVEVENPKTSNAATNSKEQNVEDILETGESLDRTDIHKVENELNEVLEAIAEPKYQGVEAVIEGDVMSHQHLPTGNSTEQLLDPSSSMPPKEQDHETTLTEKCKDKSRKNDEILVNESSEASVATNAKQETRLLKENSRELEVSTSECEFIGNKEDDNPDEEIKEEAKEESITLHKATASEPEENSSKTECTEQNFDATCLREETRTEAPKDEPKPNQDCKTQGETGTEEEVPPNESTEHLVRNSKESQVFEKETKEEILEDVELRAMDITEETSLKKVEQENIIQVNSTGLDSEDKGTVNTGLQETGSDDVCIKAKIAEASEMGENKDVQIPKAETDKVSGAGKETEQERENKTEWSETTTAISETVEASYTDFPLESDEKKENLLQREENSVDPIGEPDMASREIEKSSVNEKVQDEDKNLCPAPVLNSEKKISESEEVEPANCIKSTDASEFREDDELETFTNEKLGITELEKSTFEDEKTANDASLCNEARNKDTNNAVPEQENSARNSKSILTEDVEIERAVLEAKAGDLSHKIEGSGTTSASIISEENFESIESCDQFRSASESVAENQSSKQLPQDSAKDQKSESREEKITGQDFRRNQIKMTEEVELRSDSEKQINRGRDQTEMIKDVILTEEVPRGYQKTDESSNTKEEIIKEESFPKELQMASRLTEIGNEIKDSEALPSVNLEATEFSEDTETRNSQEAEYHNWDLEASSNMKLPEEETKTCIEKPISIASSALEISGETVEEANTGEANDAPVTLKTEDTSLEESHLHDKSVWAFDTASDDKNLREITVDANLLGAGVGSLKFEESSGEISLATTGQTNTDKEGAIVENPDAEFEVEKIITSDAVSNPEEQVVEDILGQGKSPTTDRTGTDKPEEEINEVFEAICEPTYQGAEAVIEGDIIPNQTLSTGYSTDQFLEPSSSETRTTEESEQKSSKNNETLVGESSDGSFPTSKEVTYLQKNKFRVLEASSLGLEENKQNDSPDEAKKEESISLEEATTTQSEPEENQSEKANEITKNKISNEQSTEEKEVVMDSPVASPDEETFRNINQEDEVKIVECYGEIPNQKGETMKNTIQNEELSEELDAGGERAVEDHHHSSAGNRTFTVCPPQDAHEGENVEEAPIKIDLQRKHDGKDCGETDKDETTLSKEVNSSKVDLVKNGKDILVAGDKEIMVRNHEVENLDLEFSPVTDMVAEEVTREEVEEVFEPATKEPSHDTIETYDVQNENENTNESESPEDNTKSTHTHLESALNRNCVQEEQGASAIKPQFSTPTESLHEEAEDTENGKTRDEKQEDFIPEEQARDKVHIPEEGMYMKDVGEHIKHEEPIDLLTKEGRMKLNEAEIQDGEIQDQNVSSHTKYSGKEASQKVGTVDVTECGEISQSIDKDPLAIPDGQILIEPNSNESTKANISTGNKDVSLVQQLESGKILGAEPKAKGVECQEEKRMGEECKDTTEKPISTDSDKISPPDILQGPSEGALNMAEDLTKEKGLPENEEDLQDDKTETAEVEEPKTDEDVEDENKRVDSGSDAPVMVEASRDMDIKVSPNKKSHTSILSGVGSKVKHSIAKVKKVITGKSSHPKPSSPK